MIHNNKEVLNYWNDPNIESMYDKNLINLETKLIISKLGDNLKILDAGCGEGEATLEYARISGTFVKAVDFSETRLDKAKERLKGIKNVSLEKIDFLSDYNLDKDFDIIISQRFLINLMDWELQKKVILDFMSMLKSGGRLLLFEGSKDGVDELNSFRVQLGLDSIDVKWHNLFLQSDKISNLISENGFKLIEKDGIGDYFIMTRGVRPYFEKDLNWDNDFNKIVSMLSFKNMLNLRERFSRLVLWVIEKP